MAITDMGASAGLNTIPSKGILLQPDGSMFMAVTANNRTSVSKYHANGSPYLTYGTAGFSNAVAMNAVQSVQQPDGKIIVVGYVGSYWAPDLAIARFNTDGSLDSSFGGKAILTFDFGYDIADGVAIQKNGKIIFVGTSSTEDANGTNIKILRFNTDGSLDQGFATGGIQTTYYSTYPEDYVSAIAIRSDGKIVVGGRALLRYNADGTPDNSFDGDGRKEITPGQMVHSIGFQSNAKMVVATNFVRASFDNTGFFLTRYNDNGSLNAAFGQGGLQTAIFGGIEEGARSMAIQADDKIILSGYVSYTLDDSKNIAIARFDINGSPDSSFSGDGKQIADFGAANDDITASAVQKDGKLIVAGPTNNAVNLVVGVARFNNNGDPDNSLGGDGVFVLQAVPSGVTSTVYTSVAVQADGKAIAAGYASNGNNYDFALVRYNVNGARDQMFSGDGKQMTDFGNTDDRVVATAIQADGKIVVAGSSGSNFALARYNTDGSPDSSFDGDGLLTGNFGAPPTSLVIQPDGKIIVGSGAAVVRFNADGSLDTGFDSDGILTSSCAALALQADGKILVTAGTDYIMVHRYNIDGSLDESFGENGLFFLDNPGWGDGSNYFDPTAIAVQPDGKIVIVGDYFWSFWRGDLNYYSVLMRLNSNGSFDNTFNGGSPIYPQPFLKTLAIQGDGKIISGGFSPGPSGSFIFRLVRFTKNGVLDNTFSGDGIQTTPIGPAENRITGIALSKDKLYAVGIYGPSGVIARYSLCGCHPPTVKPTEFKAVPQQRTIVLQWQIPSDVALAGFTIERGGDSATFSPIGYVAAAENGNLQLTYSTIDKDPLPGINFYRIKIVDKEGKVSFSNIISVTMNDARVITLNVFPNPAKATIYINKKGVSEKATIRITDGNGRTLKEVRMFLNSNTAMPIYINSLPKGLYMMQIHTATEVETRRFIKE